MKYTWTEQDMNCGRIVCKPTEKTNFEPDGWTAKWTFKIGWLTDGRDGQSVVLICLADGMVTPQKPPAEMAAHLNETEMIPMPHAWLLKTVNYLRDIYDSHQP